jgi:hypothetical protein
MNNNKDLSVLIGSCDSYNSFWKNFDILFKRYWNVNTENIFIGETIPIPYTGYTNILPGKISWGERILIALENIKTEYIFFILEDYYLTESITSEIILEHISTLEEYSAHKIMLDIVTHSDYRLTEIKPNLFKFNSNSMYLNSVQPAIWKTSYLKQVLRPEYSPWDFELKGNQFASTLNNTLLIQARNKPIYFNYVRVGGRISEGWEDVFKKENLTN